MSFIIAEKVNSLGRLTMRQHEVLQLLAEGNRTKEIAKKLDLSVKTIEMHRAQLMEVARHPRHSRPRALRHSCRSDHLRHIAPRVYWPFVR